jgi:dihydroorotate dehydrogenase electron transfer subunit
MALMPLGNPFPMKLARGALVWHVGGGIGVAPLIYAARSICGARDGARIKSFLGFREEQDIFGELELGKFGEVSTDTGGFVTDTARSALAFERPDVIFSCGPAPMMAALQKICREENLKAYVSLEARMGCGVGACLVCSCPVNPEQPEYRRVCRDGPVFDIAEVIPS